MTKLTSEIRVDAPRQKVWDILADLGTVSVWDPGVFNSFCTSEAKEGRGASRLCDFPDGGYVIDRTTDWEPGKGHTLNIDEGSDSLGSAHPSFTLKDDGQGTAVTLTLEYELKPDIPVDAKQVERQDLEELIPAVLATLKYYAETGEAIPMPLEAESVKYPVCLDSD